MGARVDETLSGVLKVYRPGETSGGTGVVIHSIFSMRFAITNHHVAHAGDTVIVSTFGSKVEFQGKVLWSDRASDLSLIEYEGSGIPLSVAPFRPWIGQSVYTVGHPMGKPTVSAGIVSNVPVAIALPGAAESMVDLIQTDAWITKGFSGGPLIGFYGDVPYLYGIISSFIPETRMGFAIPSDTVMKVVQPVLNKLLEEM